MVGSAISKALEVKLYTNLLNDWTGEQLTSIIFTIILPSVGDLNSFGSGLFKNSITFCLNSLSYV